MMTAEMAVKMALRARDVVETTAVYAADIGLTREDAEDLIVERLVAEDLIKGRSGIVYGSLVPTIQAALDDTIL